MSQSRARDKAKYVHQLFESIAHKYDRMNTLLSFSQHRVWRMRAMKNMNISSGETVIDVCCGTCDWTISLAKATQTGRVIGLDFSEEMLAVGQRKINNLQLKEINLIKGDAMKLPFLDNSFDHATIGFALRNVTDFKVVLNEMMRVVKPGGQVISLELSKPTSRPFRWLYYFYIKNILPLLGYVFAKSYDQYRWIPESLVHFPDYRGLQKIMTDIGLENVIAIPFTGGIAALHIGKKPERGN